MYKRQVKNGVIRKSSSSSLGTGSVLGNVKNGVVKKSSSSSLGTGSTIGKVKDFSMKGGEYMDEASAVACYHFLIKNIF